MTCSGASSLPCRIVLVWLVAACLPGIAAGEQDDWPAWRYDAGRTAASPCVLPAELRLQWKRELPAPCPAFPNDPRLCFDRSYEPIVAGKRIIVPSMVTDSVTALDSDTGEEQWTLFADAPVRFAPLAWENKIYFVSDDGCLYCVNANDGRLMWKFCGLPADRVPYKFLGNERLISRWPARGGPVLADGTVYFAAGLWPSEGVFVYAIDAATGRQLWANRDAGFVKDGLLDHSTRRDGGLSPQGYLAVLGSKLIVPCGRALPAMFDRKTGQMEPYTSGWGGRIALAKGSWYACGIGRYLFQSGDMFELTSHPARADSEGNQQLQVSLVDFASHMNASLDTARQWIKSFKLETVEQAGEPLVRVRSGGPVTYLSWWTFRMPNDLRPGEQHALENRVRLQVDPTNVKELGVYREPVLTPDTIYYSVAEVKFSKRIQEKHEDRRPATSADYTEIVASDIGHAPTWSSTYQGGWGTPHRLVQWPAARFNEAWSLPSELKVHIKAGRRLYAGARDAVAAIDLPAAGGQPTVSWRAAIEGTPTRMLAAHGQLLVVTAEGSLYCFGTAQSDPRTFARQPASEPSADPWTARAEAVLRQTGVREGYCLALGLGSGRLIEELARQSKLHIIVIDSDADRVAAARKRLHAAGLYGQRVHVVPGDLQSLRLPPLMASLIVSEDLQRSGFYEQAATIQRLFTSLRPYGGIACLPLPAGRHAALAQAVEQAKLARVRLTRSEALSLLSREGALPDAADWMHESGDAAHTFASQDRGAKPPFGVLWFGGEVDRVIPCLSGPIPRIAGGRMFLQIQDDLHGVDIYTGRHLWKRPLAHAGCFVAIDSEVYALSAGECLRIDPATGESSSTIRVPPEAGGVKATWQEIRVAGDKLLGTIGRQLVCLDRKSGQFRWRFQSQRDGINFAAAPSTAYCVDYWLPLHRRRGEARSEEGTISALDLQTGSILWQASASTPVLDEPKRRPDLPYFVQPQLAYGQPNDVLMFTRNQSTVAAYQGATGKLLWAKDLPLKNPPNAFTSAQPPIVLPGLLVTHAGETIDLLTGDHRSQLWKTNSEMRGCGRALGSPCLVTMRDAHLSVFDVADGQHLYVRGIRGGCTNSLIPAGGILNAPNYGRHCTCNYPVSTSLGLVTMPETIGWDAAGR